MKKKIFSLLILLTFLVITPVSAKEINEFYPIADDNVKLSDDVNGDTAVAGNIIDMLGNIDGIGFIAGQTVNVKGELEYGFIAGNDITIDGSIEKSIYAAGNNITFSKNASIGRDIFMIASQITLNGKLDRNINVSATKVIIESDAVLNGNVSIDADEIIIKDNVSLEGTLKYNDGASVNISDKADIGDVKVYKDIDNNSVNTTSLLQSILNMVVVFLVIIVLLPSLTDKIEKVYDKKKNNYLKNIGIGFLLLVSIPTISLLLLVSNIGMYLGLIILAIYMISIYLAFIISGFILGNLLLGKLMKLNTNKYLSGIIGIVLLKLLMLIPVFGTLLGLVSITLGLATIWNLVQKDEKVKDSDVIDAKVEVKKTNKVKKK